MAKRPRRIAAVKVAALRAIAATLKPARRPKKAKAKVRARHEGVYEIESLLAKEAKVLPGHKTALVHYLVKWKGYPRSAATWEKRTQLMRDGQAGHIRDFHIKQNAETGAKKRAAAQNVLKKGAKKQNVLKKRAAASGRSGRSGVVVATFTAARLGLSVTPQSATQSGGERGVVVAGFTEGRPSPARECGVIKVGHVLLSVNGVDVTSMAFKAAMRVLARAGRPVALAFGGFADSSSDEDDVDASSESSDASSDAGQSIATRRARRKRGRASAKPARCAKCDGEHDELKCPHFAQPREVHADAVRRTTRRMSRQ
jgi:hypothetical protein